MTFRLRVARTKSSDSQSTICGGRPLIDHHGALRACLASRLPAVTLALLTEPVRSSDGQYIEWYSDLAGEPVPLTRLQGDARARAETLLRDRLASLSAQADRLAAEGHATEAEALRLASRTPDPDMVHVVNGQPVLVNWDRQRAQAAAAIPVVPPAAPVAPIGRPWWRWLIWLLALVLILALLGLLLRSCGPNSLPWGAGGDSAPAVQATDDEAALRAEALRLEQELRDRLAACPAPAPTVPPAAPVPPEPPKEEAPVVPEAPVAPPKPQPDKPLPPPPAPAKTAPPKPQAALPAKPPEPPAQPQKTASCPKPIPKWQAPELVVLLDGSGSMGLPTSMTETMVKSLVQRARSGDRAALQQILSLQRSSGGPGSRIAAAKEAVNGMVQTLPPVIDIGLVVFGECKGVDNYKFFSAAERPQLSQLLNAVKPREGTPLARGLERAGNMVDGVSVPAVIVVVSDGEDSCNGDPCAVARQLKARKPQLKINVVDVDGSGAGRCMAEATGGKVLGTHDGMDWQDLIRKATEQPVMPPGCR